MTAGRVVFIGAVHEAMNALAAVAHHPEVELSGVVTLSPELAANTSGVADIAGAARDLGLSPLLVEDVNAPSVVEHIQNLAPDLLVVVGWTRLIGVTLLQVPTMGCVGFHASLLPKNRGRAPVNWAIIRGESSTGNTMMLLDAGVDSGLIVDQRRVDITPDDTCQSVYERIATAGADMLRDNLGPLLRGEASLVRQDESSANMLPKRVPDMGVTDWTRSAQEIHDWVRGQTLPYPGAFTHFGGRRLMLWSSSLPAAPARGTLDGEAGEVIGLSDEGFHVQTGEGRILISSVSWAGQAPAPAVDWARAAHLRRGDRFDLPPEDHVLWSLGAGPRPVEMLP
jgi:methionyl-tRNA formyltransferase